MCLFANSTASNSDLVDLHKMMFVCLFGFVWFCLALCACDALERCGISAH